MVYGIGRRGGGGFGFRGNSPSWPYVGRGRGGLPRCWHPEVSAAPFTAGSPYFAGMTREAEVEWLRRQAEAVRSELGRVEARIHDLESVK